MPLPRIQKRGATGETARLITSQFNVTTPDGLVLNQSPTGQQWLDQISHPFPARITGDGSGSGSGGGWGSGHTGWHDFDHHYDWVEVVPVTIANELKFVTKENGRSGTSNVRPAVEANGVPDVPTDAIVWLYPGTIEGQEPTWYFFWWTGEISGSGSGGGMTVTCSDGTRYNVSINGNSIVVS
jgi:hypothetical protein